MIMTPHKPALDHFTPAEIRVLCEYLLYTMDIEQREKVILQHPGLYLRLFPDTTETVIAHLKGRTDGPQN